MTLARRYLFTGAGVFTAPSAAYPSSWGITRFAGNPVIDVANNPSETHEQYVPAPIRLPNGDIWVYVKGSYVIYAWKSTDGGETFSLQNGGAPVISLGSPGAWDDSAVVEPCVVYDLPNGVIHLWYKGTGNVLASPASWSIGHATALDTDPTTFTKDAANPISTDTNASADIGYNVYDYAISDVIKIGSTYHFYGYVAQGTTFAGSVYTLIQATGSTWNNPTSITTIYAGPSHLVIRGHPSVFRMPGTGTPVYVMLYTYGSTPRSIRGLQSSDGVTWSTPDTIDIMAPVPGTWEGEWVYAQALLKVSVDPWTLPYVDGLGRWLLYYSGQPDSGPPQPTGHHDNSGLAYLSPS